MWPILGKVVPFMEVFIIGVFQGYNKPFGANTYLSHFINEMKELEKSGMIVNNSLIKVNIRLFIRDALARSFILGKQNN